MLIFYNFLAAAIVALIFFGILYLVLKLGENMAPARGAPGSFLFTSYCFCRPGPEGYGSGRSARPLAASAF